MTERPTGLPAYRLGESGYRALFENANDAIVVFDPETEEVLLANQRAGEMYGLPVEELIGRSIKSFTKDIELGEARIEETVRQGLFHRFESCQHRIDGSEMVLEITASALDFGGRKAILSINRDVTERKRAEAALRESREREVLIARSVPVAVYSAPLGDEADTLWISDGVRKISGFDPQRFLDEPRFWRQRIHPEDRDRVLAAFRDARLAGGVEVEYRWQAADGEYRWFFDTAAVREANGDGQEVIGTIVDVTAQHVMQEQLLQAQKIDAIGRLAGGIAHDFNNLLQGMLGAATLCKLEVADVSKAREWLDELEEYVQRGSQLARQLLLFSRHETPSTVRVDLRVLTEESLRLLGRLLRENIQVEVAPGERPLWVDVDHGQMQQVIMNLAINAADSMPGGGTLRVATGETGSGSVWLEVADTGHGIPEHIRDRVFEPFFTTKPAGEGTGLGLSVAHGIVSRHGGGITFSTSEGRGSVFRVTLPRLPEGQPEPASQPPRWDAVRASGERVLLVEDNDALRSVMTRMLEHLGYRPVAVRSAEEALGLCGESSFDLLVTDLMLPGMSGRELAAALRGQWPDLPVLVMSGYASEELSSTEDGLDGITFVHKPVSPSRLAHELRKALADSKG